MSSLLYIYISGIAHCIALLTVASVLESEPSLKLCPICSNEAGRHNHYGGRGCSSCRAFFRRSVQNNAYKKFVCKSQQSRLQFCIIDSKSWKSCKFCRYHKVPTIHILRKHSFFLGGGLVIKSHFLVLLLVHTMLTYTTANLFPLMKAGFPCVHISVIIVGLLSQGILLS